MNGAQAASRRLGPFLLAPGIAPGNAAVLMFGTFSTIAFVTFLGFVNPYLLNVLGIPAERQGALSGLLVSLQETVVILLASLVGATSDRTGRRPVLVIGLLAMAAGFILYPMAGSEAELVALRLVYSVGLAATTVMMSTCIAEYISDGVRGRWMGVIGVCNGLGVVVTALGLAKLPQVFANAGFDDAAALRVTFWLLAGAILLLALAMRRGLAAPGRGAVRSRSSLPQQTMLGITEARQNPRVALGYLTAFAARGDLVIITTFVSLWVVQAGIAQGMSAGAATARAGMVFGISQGVGLLWAPVMGLLLDRLPRLLGISFAFALAGAGYLAIGLADNPLGTGMLVAVVVAGVGEASAVVSAGVLIGQEAPGHARGAVLGTFALAGAVGMVCLTFAGGQVYDRIGPGAPFVMMGAVNLLVCVAAWRVSRSRAELRAA